MLSTLNQFLSEKKAAARLDRNKRSSRYDVIGRLYFLLDRLTEEQKLGLLQQLLGDKAVDHFTERGFFFCGLEVGQEKVGGSVLQNVRNVHGDHTTL